MWDERAHLKSILDGELPLGCLCFYLNLCLGGIDLNFIASVRHSIPERLVSGGRIGGEATCFDF